jgi:hypothetical protein
VENAKGNDGKKVLEGRCVEREREREREREKRKGDN